MLILTGAVLIKTQTDPETNAPPKTAPSAPEVGILTIGLEKETIEEEDTILTKKNGAEPILDEEKKVIATEEPITEPEEPISNVVAYTVVEGDTMYRIIKNAYGTFSEKILTQIAIENNLDNPNDLAIGDVVKLPVILLETSSGSPKELKPQQQ